MQCRIEQRVLPLRRPFTSSGWTINERNILLFSVHSASGASIGWGEAAPLQVFGTESLDTCRNALRELTLRLSSFTDPGSLKEIEEVLDGCPELRKVPTARFAVETALLDLYARTLDVTLSNVLGGNRRRVRLPVNTVIGAGDVDATVSAATAAWARGYRCVKLKVGSGELEEDIVRIRGIRQNLPPELRLRLDANGAWEFNLAEEALREFALYDIEYIEQPVPEEELDELAALTALSIIPVAADESAQHLDQARALMDRHAVDLFILKPMVSGGLLPSRRFALEAQERGFEVVFTSLLDSSVGRHAVAQLCASLPVSDRAQGLATGTLFLEDTHRDHIVDGMFMLPDSPGLGIAPGPGAVGKDVERV
ncbi:MAG: o-succinylbenzoate synthase [Bacteroidetes bacterium]|nr:o-succinylbenzoate synthase [Bacteroidota bacterium]